MKPILLFFILFSSFLFSQNDSDEKIDSIAYYTHLRETKLNKNKYSEALYYNQKAINYSITNDLLEEQKIQTFKLGKLYYDVKKYDDALNAFNKSLFLNKSIKSNSLQAKSYYYLGMCYMQKQSFDNAKICFNQAQSIIGLLQTTYYSDLINLEYGIIHKKKGEFKAAKLILNALISKSENTSMIDTKAEALYQIGTIEMKENLNNLALNYFQKALDLNSNTTNLEQRSNILLALSKVYEMMLDDNNAYVYLKQHTNLKERISILDNEKLGIDDYKKFKESERLKELEIINKEKSQNERKTKFSKLINILSISLISILSLLSLSLYRNNIIRNQSNLLLEQKNKELIEAKDKAIKASNARSDFLSTVSHELRTPLNAINGIAHLLLKEKPKKEQMHYLESLQFSGNYLTNFINDILEINKIDSNNAQIENIPFDLKELLENIKNSLKELASTNNNSFWIEIDSTIPHCLIGDPTKLSQIILNLINNALKFTHDGNVSVETKLVTNLNDKKASISFKVKDTGIGIPQDKLESVFDSFSQGSVGINRKYGGTGLGLTIVKKLVQILGGEIQLESVVDKGSTFSFELDFEISNEVVVSKTKLSKKSSFILKGKKILIVEDNKINQMISKKMLENKEIICEVVDNGEDAITTVQKNNYDMILMDIHLPGINGTITAQKIREFNKTIPILALTAISLDENRELLLSFGMNDVITKPFVPEEFYLIIEKHI